MNSFVHWWQHLPEKMNPVIFQLGPLKLQYYGLMYILAFAATYLMVLYRIRHEESFDFSKDQVLDLTAYMILGLYNYHHVPHVPIITYFNNLSVYIKL